MDIDLSSEDNDPEPVKEADKIDIDISSEEDFMTPVEQ